jgi:hypothetical protein
LLGFGRCSVQYNSDIITLDFSQSRRHWHMIVLSIIARHRALSVADPSSRKILEKDATDSRKKRLGYSYCTREWERFRSSPTSQGCVFSKKRFIVFCCQNRLFSWVASSNSNGISNVFGVFPRLNEIACRTFAKPYMPFCPPTEIEPIQQNWV